MFLTKNILNKDIKNVLMYDKCFLLQYYLFTGQSANGHTELGTMIFVTLVIIQKLIKLKINNLFDFFAET